jgi:hypothetical protein
MTANLRALARELALEAYWTTPPDAEKSIDAIEQALLRFAAEALRAEPDKSELKAGAETIAVMTLSDPDTPMGVEANQVFRAMAEVRARGIENDRP